MVSMVTPGGRGSVPSAGLLASGMSTEAEDAALEDRANRAAVRVATMRAKKARNASNFKGGGFAYHGTNSLQSGSTTCTGRRRITATADGRS